MVGHNGSGKSTAMNILARALRPNTGELLVDGEDAHCLDRRAFARRIAYLAQNPGAGADYSVVELVGLGRYPWHGPFGRPSNKDREAVERALVIAGLKDFSDRQVASLSGGERQSVWIALTLAQDAACLLLDEPISALDLNHQIEVLRLLSRLTAEEGLAVIAVLHDINLAARFCNRMIALKGGRIVVDGTPETVMTAERLEDIFGIRMVIGRHPVVAGSLYGCPDRKEHLAERCRRGCAWLSPVDIAYRLQAWPAGTRIRASRRC